MAKITRYRNKFQYRYTDHDGVRRRRFFLRKEDAVSFKKIKEGELEQIKTGLVTPDRIIRFSSICDRWLSGRAKSKRSEHHDISMITHHLKPYFGELRLSEITQSTVDDFCLSRPHLSKKTLHNHITLLIAIFNYAKNDKLICNVPKIKKPKIKICDKDFSYLRNDSEIQRFLAAAFELDSEVGCLYATAIYTGMRAGELAGLKWGDIDFDRNLITIQRSYDGPTKSDKTRFAPLQTPLRHLLLRKKNSSFSEHVFINKVGRPLKPSDRVFQEKLHKTLLKAGFTPRLVLGKKKPYIVFHDLRHTFASYWMMTGGCQFKLQKVLGHSSPSMTNRYAHLSPDEFAKDANRFPDLTGQFGSEKLVVLAERTRESELINDIQNSADEFQNINSMPSVHTARL